LVFDVEIINEELTKNEHSFIPNKYWFEAGYERKDQGSQRSGLWQTLEFSDKIVRKILERHMAIKNTGRA
jgi:hypothetical protein